MANPITWQNVTGPAMGNPAQFMQMAQNGVDGAFDKLGAVLKQREDTDKANWDQGAINNSATLRNALYGVNTVGGMEAAQKSGQFNTMLNGFGAQVKDPAALQAAIDGRMAVLQGQSTANSVFADETLDRSNRGAVDQIGMDIARNNMPAAQAGIDANPQIRNRAILQKSLGDAQQAEVLRTRATATNAQEVLLRPGALTAQTDAHNLSEANQKHLIAQANSQDADARSKDKEKGDSKFIRDSVKTVFADFRAKDGAKSAAIGEVTGALGLPRLPTGAPDMEAMNPDQRTRLQKALREKQLDVPLSTSAAMAQLESAGIERGLSASGMEELRKSANGLLSSNKGLLSTADQTDLTNYNKALAERKVEAGKNNMFYNPPEENAVGKGLIMEKINKEVLDSTGTKNRIKDKLSGWMDKGLPFEKDGKTQYIPIPPKLMDYALKKGIETDAYFFTANSTSEKVEAALRSAMQDPEFMAQREEADHLRAGGNERLSADKEARARILAGNSTSAETLEAVARGGGSVAPLSGTPALTLPTYNAPRNTSFAPLPANSKSIYGRNTSSEKKSPEIAPVVAAQPESTGLPLNRAAAPVFTAAINKPPVVTHTEGFSLGDPSKKSAPLDTSKVQWGKAEQVVDAGVAARKGSSIVLTVAKGSVKDADTVHFADGAKNGILNGDCRIDTIDARETSKSFTKPPQPGQAYGEEAGEILRKMIEGKQVNVTVTQAVDGTGKRSMCQIDIQGKNVPAELVKAGAAYLTERYWKDTSEPAAKSDQREALRLFQKNAIDNKVGMFSLPQSTWEEPKPYRDRMKQLQKEYAARQGY